MSGSLSVALTGNPNTGKSTIFNELTGARQKIGNWPGVTVDKKVGYVRHNDKDIMIVDQVHIALMPVLQRRESLLITSWRTTLIWL